MSFHCQLYSPLYSDKAVQTEPPMAAVPLGTDTSGADLCSGTADLAINELLSRSGSAYSQSKPSEVPTPALSCGPVNGKTWLDYNHPSGESRGVQRRVVSHPESVTCEPKTPYFDPERLRVVSLPEPISLNSISKYQNQDLERQSPGNREYPPDLPYTPSPPSSPDSVVIVGNEAHLPSSFFPPIVDENGWTTWANSPPRPIPALHGPSSLPYARCPSGAEGTVVESGDLATKVWGLGSDEGHRFRLKSPQPHRSSGRSAPLPLDFNFNQTVTSSALARHRDAVIDLVKPSTFYCYPETYDTTGGRLISFDGTFSSPAGHAGRPNLCTHIRSYQDMHSANVTASTSDCLELAPAAFGEEPLGRNQGLLQILSNPGFARPSCLNSAAPSFVPAYPTRTTDSGRNCIQPDAEFGDSECTSTTRDLVQRHANSDLTPASTASPLWSPVFPSVPTIVLGDYDPWIYSPQTDLDDKFTTQQSASEDFMIVQQRPDAEQGLQSSIKTCHVQPYVAHNVKGATHSITLSSCNSTEANLCERRGHLSHQQPSSVPMTHLMQRRLPLVVEENIYELSSASRRSALVPGQSKFSDAREILTGGELSTSSRR